MSNTALLTFVIVLLVGVAAIAVQFKDRGHSLQKQADSALPRTEAGMQTQTVRR